MTDHSLMKLGRSHVRHDPRTLLLSSYLQAHLPPAPAACSWSAKIQAWPMYANDSLGDCTAAAAGHMIQCWTANATTERIPSQDDVVKFYRGSTGYDPSDPSSDQGGVELDVLRFWRKTGLGGDKCGAFVSVNPQSKTGVMDGIFLCGGLYVGVALPLSAQRQRVWDVPSGGAHGKGAPGTWGGHAISLVSYDARGVTCVTWGGLKRMTWAFFRTYCDEAYAILSPDFLSGSKAPNGFDVAALQTDLALLKTA